MTTTKDKIVKLSRQLYPTGRAFRMAPDSVFEKFHKALAVSEAQAYEDALATLDVILADNDNFTEDDATRWEERLGLITNTDLTLEERKTAIIRKYNHPGTIPARQNWEYLQDQLHEAGFTQLYVHENIFLEGSPPSCVTISPTEILGADVVGLWDHGDDAEMGLVEHGDGETGSVYEDCVANYIDPTLDKWFDTGDNLRNTFFISSEYVEILASVPEPRRLELRDLILKTKPVQTVAFLFITYT